jgi:hypothetical protein
MRPGELFTLGLVLLALSSCEPCLADPCVQNEFAIHGARTNAPANVIDNKVFALTTTGPCYVDPGRYSCVLSKVCADLAIVGTAGGVCHLEGQATATGPFSIDVPYTPCNLRCGGTPAYVTNLYDVYLSDSSSSKDAGVSDGSEANGTSDGGGN